MRGAMTRRGELKRWIAERGIIHRRRLQQACRDRLADLDLPRPYSEESWVAHVQDLIQWPIKVVDLTEDLRRRATAVNSDHVHGHTFAMRDGFVIAVDPTATADSRQLTIAHELAHIAWGDLKPSAGAPSMEAFFRSQGEDIPDVVRFMLSGSGVSRRAGVRPLRRRGIARRTTEVVDLHTTEDDMARALQDVEERAEVTATLMARYGAPHPEGEDEGAVDRFWQS